MVVVVSSLLRMTRTAIKTLPLVKNIRRIQRLTLIVHGTSVNRNTVQCNRNITQGTFRDCSTGIVCRVRISQHGIQRNRLILRTLLCLGSTSSFSDGTTYTDARLSRTCCVMIRATVRLNTTRLNRARRVQCFRVPVYENNIRLVFLYE